MKKLGVLLYGIILFVVSVYGLLDHSYYVDLLVNFEKPYMFVRIAVVTALMVYVFVPYSRTYVTKTLLGLGGIVLVFLGLTPIVSPNLFGLLDTWMLFGDILTLIEGGILAIILSVELPARRTELMARSFVYARLLIATHPRNFTYSPAIQPARILKIPS